MILQIHRADTETVRDSLRVEGNSAPAIVESYLRFAPEKGDTTKSIVVSDIVTDTEVTPFLVSDQKDLDISTPESKDLYLRLQVKIAKKTATADDLKKLNQLRMGRQKLVRQKTNLADYVEMKRLALIEQKLKELKGLFVPIPYR